MLANNKRTDAVVVAALLAVMLFSVSSLMAWVPVLWLAEIPTPWTFAFATLSALSGIGMCALGSVVAIRRARSRGFRL